MEQYIECFMAVNLRWSIVAHQKNTWSWVCIQFRETNNHRAPGHSTSHHVRISPDHLCLSWAQLLCSKSHSKQQGGCVYVYLFIVATHSGARVGNVVIFLHFIVPGLHKSSVVHILGLRDKEVLSHCDKGRGLVCTLWVVCKDALVCIVLSHHCQFFTPLLIVYKDRKHPMCYLQLVLYIHGHTGIWPWM